MRDKNLPPPPREAGFWELFDYFWDNGVGNQLSQTGEPVAWSAPTLESALDHEVDVRSIENWRSRKFMPSRDRIQKLANVISGGDPTLRQAWAEALLAARRNEQLKARQAKFIEQASEVPSPSPSPFLSFPIARPALMALGAGLLALVAYLTLRPAPAAVANIRICDAPYFDREVKKCSQHVAVFVEGIKEVFLSFDLENLPHGAPFERWWIRNGERVTGRTSFNDEAWPGYTYWRPEGGLPFGQYVVRVVVDGRVFTQTFQIQKEAFNVEE